MRVARSFLLPIVLIVIGIVAPSDAGAQGQAGPRRVSLADYYRIETAGSPAISPDGRFVAFVRTFIVEDENRRQSEIWLAATDGATPPLRLTSPAFSASAPQWSPDGTLLAFTSRRPVPQAGPSPAGRPEGERGAARDESSVWFLRMDRPGGEAFQIPGVAGTPVFSPDNQWIAFTKPTPPGPPRKPEYASDFDRKVAERFKGRAFDWMQYRFDGRGYLPDPRDPAATPPQEIYVVPRAGGTPKQLTTLGVNASDLAWRPDSRALAFTANTHQRDEHVYEHADLWTVTIDAAAPPGAPTRLTDDGFDHAGPSWSPDGRTLVVQRKEGLSAVIASKQPHGAPTDLYRIAAAGGTPRSLTPEWDLLPGATTWSPDGRFVYFSGGTGGVTHLFRVPASGGPVDQVTPGDRADPRDRGGFTFTTTMDRVAYTRGDSTHPAEAFVGRLEGGRVADERKLSAVSDALLQTLDLGRTDRIVYRSKDGTEIEGWVTLPPGYDASKGPYPLILGIHGGPHGAYGPSFSFPFQLLAAKGYVVLYTNPRGSTGYGEKFLWATWGGNWGNQDYEDVMAGVDHALTKYAVDPKRLGVTGYSYGGFLTNWIITRTTRFAAAAAGAGISNWISDYGTADIPRTKESEFLGPPWEPAAAALLLRQSPIMFAGAVATPTLFVHGESDVRVPMEQAEQMYLALKKRRVPARFVRYPDSYHGGWSPWNTVHRYDQEITWWDRWLGKDGGRGQTTATESDKIR